MEYIVIILTLIGLFLLIFIKGMYDESKRKKKVLEEMKTEYGEKPLNKYNPEDMAVISDYFYRTRKDNSVDDITAMDLELDDIFKRLNYCRSSMGAAVLYSILRNPVTDYSLDNLEKKISYFQNETEKRAALRSYFNDIGKLKVSLFECLDLLDDIKKRNLFIDFAAILFLIAGIVITFFNPYIGIVVLILTLCYNIVTYYSARGKIEPYIISFGYINRYIKYAKPLSMMHIDCLSEDIDKIKSNTNILKGFTKHANFVVNNASANIGAGNPLEIVMDYLKMLFHVDIFYFYGMLEELKRHREAVISLYETLGNIESAVSIAYFRASLEEYCIPVYGEHLSVTDAYHPLIDNPAKNSIKAEKGVLITGSNASGKSTFLKTIALNVLLSETINTSLSKEYIGKGYDIFSSMALRDNLSGSDSYFMVEIKAMKRILDYKKAHPDRNVLCFVDEVLRGTNTLERIASSTEILKYLSSKDTLCFAATHDGELTYLLEDIYDNYHFEEEILNGDVKFNYCINKGRAVTRNAIKLLSVMGFPDQIIDSAEESAGRFLKTGEWK